MLKEMMRVFIGFALGVHFDDRYFHANMGASHRMIKYLIENGAKLVVTPDDWHPCHFLQFLLRRTSPGRELLRKVQYIVESFIDLGHPLHSL